MASTLDLGVIGNCQISALIDRNGCYVWLCLPRPDGDPVFCSLLRNDSVADKNGFFTVELVDCIQSEQRYERNTAILQTILTDSRGAQIRIIDFCPRFQQFGRNFRPGTAIRIVEQLSGRPTVIARLRPMTNYGKSVAPRHIGNNHLRFEATNMTWRISTDMSLNSLMEERPIVLHEKLDFIISADETIPENIGTMASRFLEETRRYWSNWTRGLAVPFEWQEAVIRSAITLKLCSFEDSGAVLAAITTSIPESADSGRNWDYRYCWLRDSYFTIHALNRLGATRTMEGYLRYINNVFAARRVEPLQPVYGISGEAELTEVILPQLSGYRGMGPVRIGNQAFEQVQHDVYGAVILAAMQSFFDQRLASPADAETFRQLEFAGDMCWQCYDKPDAGIWEYRGRARLHTFPSVMCWAGVDRLARIAHYLKLSDREHFWRERANTMHKRIMDATWDEKLGTFTEAWNTPSLDASVLLLAELNFVDAKDPKFISTINHLERHLRRDKYFFRYVNADDFGKPENAFNICTFWYINALAAVGRTEEARDLFDNILSKCNSLGLLSEDINPVTNELWGNYPQTYSMVGIINAAVRLSCSWEDAL